MEVHLGDNSSIANIQIGNNNKMMITGNTENNSTPVQYWEELSRILDALIEKEEVQGGTSLAAQNALEYVKKKDQHGLAAFLKRNTNVFLRDVLCNVASAGLVYFLGI